MRLLILFLMILSGGIFAKDSPPHVLAAAKVRAESANKLAKKYDMLICGAGGAMMTSVEELGVSFIVYRPLSKFEARELIVKCLDEFLEDINASQELQPYLSVRPFALKNVKLVIQSESPPGKDVCYPNYSIVSNRGEAIVYTGRLSETDTLYRHEERETYEEARKQIL